MEILFKLIFSFFALLGIGPGLYAFHNYFNMLDSYHKPNNKNWVFNTFIGQFPLSKRNLSSEGLIYRKRFIQSFVVTVASLVIGFFVIFLADTAAFYGMFEVFDSTAHIKPNNALKL